MLANFEPATARTRNHPADGHVVEGLSVPAPSSAGRPVEPWRPVAPCGASEGPRALAAPRRPGLHGEAQEAMADSAVTGDVAIGGSGRQMGAQQRAGLMSCGGRGHTSHLPVGPAVPRRVKRRGTPGSRASHCFYEVPVVLVGVKTRESPDRNDPGFPLLRS